MHACIHFHALLGSLLGSLVLILCMYVHAQALSAHVTVTSLTRHSCVSTVSLDASQQQVLDLIINH